MRPNRFSHAKFGGYLVTRLDGYTAADAKALVTRSLAAEQNIAQILARGKVLLDVEPVFGLGDQATQPGPITGTNIPAESAYSEFNADMRHAYDVLTNRSIPVELDLTTKFIGGRSNLLGYFHGAATMNGLGAAMISIPPTLTSRFILHRVRCPTRRFPLARGLFCQRPADNP